MINYQLLKIQDAGSNSATGLLAFIRGELIPCFEAEELSLYGIFSGLFGLYTNELYLATFAESPQDLIFNKVAEAGFSVNERKLFVPTVRPVTHQPLKEEGVYVFRWFDVKNADVDEIAKLSEEAWLSFEAGFDTEVQALFAESSRAQSQGQMLLLTWYANLTVWQESRRPPEAAIRNFMRRHELTRQAIPIATRLI